MRYKSIFFTCIITIFLCGCSTSRLHNTLFYNPELIEVVTLDNQPTGIAVSQEGRLFINFPRWNDTHTYSVVEILPDGTSIPYPNKEWNWWDAKTSLTSKKHFVCVQSVYIDTENFLWILDPASPYFSGVIDEGAKLVKVNLATDKVVDIIYFDESIAPEDSYLNDIRVDTEDQFAYITDSGRGAIIVVNLTTHHARRILDSHHSTTANPDIKLVIEDTPFLDANGSVPQIHSDAIALDAENEYLYFQALTGNTLYRFNTDYLKDETIHKLELDMRVKRYAQNIVVDGIVMDHNNNIYLTALEQNAIIRFNNTLTISKILIQDDRISWPDSVCISPDGFLYFTISQIHRMPQFNNGIDKRQPPYSVFKIDISRFLK